MNEKPSLFDRSLETYVKHLQGRNVSTHTITAYRTDLSQFFTWLEAQDGTVTGPISITRSHIIDYLSFLSGQGRSGVTRARKLASIREYCKFLCAEQTIERSPAEAIAMPKKERKARVYLRVDEYMRLLGAALGNTRDYAILQLFLQTGIRVGELVNLRVTDIDLSDQTMLVNGKGKKQRTVNLEKKATQALKNYLSVRPQSLDTHLFLNYQGTLLSVRGVVDIVEKYRNLAGIQKKFSCHSLRHTCATYKAAKGYTVRQLQALLGHEKAETSLLYTHLAETDGRKLMEATSL
jgi:site-specific recombinase XerD